MPLKWLFYRVFEKNNNKSLLVRNNASKFAKENDRFDVSISKTEIFRRKW